MKRFARVLLFSALGLAIVAFDTSAQPPAGKGGDKGGEKGERGPRGGPPMPGQILSPFMQEQLKLTDDQKKQLDALQKDLDAKLDKLLTDDQKKMLKEMRERGPGRPGGDRGPGGPGGDKGPRPSGDKGGNRLERPPVANGEKKPV